MYTYQDPTKLVKSQNYVEFLLKAQTRIHQSHQTLGCAAMSLMLRQLLNLRDRNCVTRSQESMVCNCSKNTELGHLGTSPYYGSLGCISICMVSRYFWVSRFLEFLQATNALPQPLPYIIIQPTSNTSKNLHSTLSSTKASYRHLSTFMGLLF